MAQKDQAAHIAYNNKWISEKHDRINLLVGKGEKDIIKNHAAAAGQSVNAYILEAVRARIQGEPEPPQS